MKLKQYAAQLTKLAQQYPDALVVVASDDEGNYYQPASYSPSAGHFADNEFWPDDMTEGKKVTAVCLN